MIRSQKNNMTSPEMKKVREIVKSYKEQISFLFEKMDAEVQSYALKHATFDAIEKIDPELKPPF